VLDERDIPTYWYNVGLLDVRPRMHGLHGQGYVVTWEKSRRRS
jgi:hypothetical protein